MYRKNAWEKYVDTKLVFDFAEGSGIGPLIPEYSDLWIQLRPVHIQRTAVPGEKSPAQLSIDCRILFAERVHQIC